MTWFLFFPQHKITDPLNIHRDKRYAHAVWLSNNIYAWLRNCFDMIVWWCELGLIFCRVAETRILLHSIAYEKAKLQLLLIKHDKLLVLYLNWKHVIILALPTVGDMNCRCKQEKGQQVSTGLQECEMIKLNFIPSFKRGAVDTQANYSFSKGKSQV